MPSWWPTRPSLSAQRCHLLLLSPCSFYSSLLGICAAPGTFQAYFSIKELFPWVETLTPRYPHAWLPYFYQIFTQMSTARFSLVSLAKIILPWYFLFPRPAYFFLCTYLHPAQYVFHLLLFLTVCHSSIGCKFHKGRELCIFFHCCILSA